MLLRVIVVMVLLVRVAVKYIHHCLPPAIHTTDWHTPAIEPGRCVVAAVASGAIEGISKSSSPGVTDIRVWYC